MEALLYNSTWVESWKIKLDTAFFGKEPNDSLVHRLLMLQRSNSRSPIAHTKTRWERRWSTRKIYKQKGTWHARAWGNRSPIRKWGWVAFGPRNTRNFVISMNKKERRLALFTLLSTKAKNNQVKVLESITNDLKTKDMANVFANMQVNSWLFALLPNDRNLFLSARNLEKVKPISVGYLNPQDLLKFKDLVFTKDSLEHLNVIYS